MKGEEMNMKKNYIAPQAEIVCFAPVEGLAADWYDWSANVSTGANATASQINFDVA